ncbi:NADH dehydrogenase [ubiquinone] 1 alpha subcomplex assembly factor 7 [Novosphingobium sp. CF614]|uniref:class I SAM-dependent methyltransferase n=1 Tax=Novosphingobium sp. CF614 TaxID=1884364 RepID=UPI0008E4EA4D|nr:SAM-dependent methyltransferase [Novosphingobium sp. CF614]SFF90970.1 NADH dehydrogenase [ubiquinone] 1 alpha subcomplex assembly factor 7 [Novosphingobium sp. CF614]
MAPGTESLAVIFRRLIAGYGPITLQHYMGESNARYYADRDPLGSEGDFITAPEISQMFGELIGLWLADIWIRAGRQEGAHYVELGPGRGTLARDALRAMKRYGLEPAVHFVESSAALRDIQRTAVPQAQWHHDLSDLPMTGPVLVVGNEFLDALPVRQLVKTPQGWRERMVDFQDHRFLPVAGDKPMDAAVPQDMKEAPDGTLVETCPGAAAIVDEISGRLVDQGGAALLIDYGHDRRRTGSTLQALKAHAKVDPFALPGEADLTCHVDFAAMADTALARGARHLGTVTQGHWLRELGIETRAGNLAGFAPQHAAAIHAAKERLIAAEQMGGLFKVMGLAAPAWPDGAGFR